MLIPNFGPYKLFPCVEEEIIQMSESDSEERPFSVIAFLEDSRARTKYVYISFEEEENRFDLSINETTVHFFLEKNNDGHLISLMGGCFSRNHRNAFELIYPLIQMMLSQWCFKYERPVGIYETRVFDKKHKARWSIPFASPNTLPNIKFPIIILAESTLPSLVSVFREGMNSQSHANRFLNYYKILEAYPSKGPFKETATHCKNKGIDCPRTKPRVTESLLIGAYQAEYHERFIDQKFTWCKKELLEFRDAIAHPFLDRKEPEKYIDLDSISTQAQLSAYANLLERIALAILREEFILWGKLSDDPHYAAMARSYLGNNKIMNPPFNGDG
jgi:methylamine utilization protein MauJ